MEIISHRGFWLDFKEKNSKSAFHRSFELGFGTETDLRDLDGEVVISHDMPKKNETIISFDDLLKIYLSYDKSLPLALNIKADGLQSSVKSSLKKYNIKNYFLFDMSIPDQIVSLEKGLTCFSRQSEHEKNVVLYEKIKGVWLDEFYDQWITLDVIYEHIKNNKKVYIVSPELHGRDHIEAWQRYAKIPKNLMKYCTLCTDIPEKAQEFFK